MPDWAPGRRAARLASLRALARRARREIVDELSQHLDDRWHELIAGGASPDEADAAGARRVHGRRASWRATWRRCGRRIAPTPITPRSAGRTRARRALAGPALRGAHAAEAARLRRRGRPDARARHRRQDRHLQPRERDAAAAAAGAEPRPPRLCVQRRSSRNILSYPAYAALRDGNASLDGLGAWGGITASLNADGETDLVSGVIVTGNFFDLLGVTRRPGTTARDRRRRDAWRASRGRHQPSLLADPVRRQSRTSSAREVRLNGGVHHRRRHAGGASRARNSAVMRDLYVPMMMQA